MKISAALCQARQELNLKGVSNSKLDSLILLAYALSTSKEQIIFNPDLELDSAKEKAFFALIKRRAAREPVSHLINKREFYGNDFFVDANVLDPRPDSESLIELVLQFFAHTKKPLKILELGVGSGCLIITLLKTYEMAQAIAVDVSLSALEVAQKNAKTHQVISRLKLLKSDLFSMLKSSEKFDLIISNPPYIPSEEIETLEPEVKIFEPRLALDGGVDGYDFYRKIAKQARDFLNPTGKIILEIGRGQHDEITKFFIAAGFILKSQHKDLSQVIRILAFEKS